MQKIILQVVILNPHQVRSNIKKILNMGRDFHEFSDVRIILVKSTADLKGPVPK